MQEFAYNINKIMPILNYMGNDSTLPYVGDME
jgi:hypothetical protein